MRRMFFFPVIDTKIWVLPRLFVAYCNLGEFEHGTCTMLDGGFHHESCIGQSWGLWVSSGCCKYPSMDSNNTKFKFMERYISFLKSLTDTVKCFWIQLTHGGFPKFSQCIHWSGKNAHKTLIYCKFKMESISKLSNFNFQWRKTCTRII